MGVDAPEDVARSHGGASSLGEKATVHFKRARYDREKAYVDSTHAIGNITGEMLRINRVMVCQLKQIVQLT